MKTLNKVKTSIWINALSAIIIGILFLINPQESFQMITIIAGIIITATGILDFIYYFNGWLDIYEEYIIKWFSKMFVRNLCVNTYTTYDNFLLLYF